MSATSLGPVCDQDSLIEFGLNKTKAISDNEDYHWCDAMTTVQYIGGAVNSGRHVCWSLMIAIYN